MALPRRAAARLLAALLVATAPCIASGIAPATSLAVVDTTPPSGAAELWAYDPRAQIIDVRSTFADPESGISRVDVQCDSNAPHAYANAAHLLIPALDPTNGGCAGYGEHSLWIQAWDGAGLATGNGFDVVLVPAVTLSISSPAATGQAFTITPNYPAGYTLPSDAICRWEFRWGDTASLRDNAFDETFGSLLFEGAKSSGYCGPWTFTLPYVPVRQYQVTFEVPSGSTPYIQGDSWGFADDGHGYITASVGSTERRITSSNIPLVFLLPDSYSATVGSPITYRLYPLGGIPILSDDNWIASWEGTEHVFTHQGGTSWTFTPDRAGTWAVFWNGGEHHPHVIGAGYDPIARAPDTSRPYTTPPVQRPGPGVVGSTIPTTFTWTGGDSGWGVDHYTLQRSVDGGSYGSSILTSSKSRVVALVAGHTYRFRVHAVDKAGNVGYWDYGPTFRVSTYQETSASVHWHGTWHTGTATGYWGGADRYTTATNAYASFSFTGRSFAWVAPTSSVRGTAKVYVNGVYAATVNLYSTSGTTRRIVFSRTWSTVAARTISIKCFGTAGHPRIDVDGLVAFR